MTTTQLYPYQEKAVEEIDNHFLTLDSVLLQLPTGAGKTFVFSFFIKKWLSHNPNKKVLVLVHRDELLKQTLNSLRKIGVTCESVVSVKKTLQHHSSVYVAMVETIANRLNKDEEYLNDLGLIIADECHLLLFQKVFDFFKGIKRLGCSATPISYKKISFTKCHRCGRISDSIEECCNVEMYEYTRKFTFSEMYQEIVSPVQVGELIELGSLTKELNYSVGHIDRSKISIDNKTGDFDTKSMDEEYSKSGALIDVFVNYEKLCKGKKTLIFNSSIKMNELVYERFIQEGYASDQIKILDSKNKEGGRTFILNWFKETPGAILINAGILTAGFDEETIEAIIMNRSTISFALYLQIIGRGGRITNKFFKDYFIHIDLGGNIDYFKNLYGGTGFWSDNVDWKKIFFGEGEKPRPKKVSLEDTTSCKECGAIHQKSEPECPECGFSVPSVIREKKMSNEVAQLIDEIPLPNGSKISKYCHKNGKDMAFAYTILINQTVDLFIYKYVTRGNYENTLDNGKFHDAMKRILSKPCKTFFVSGLPKTRPRSFENLMTTIKCKLDQFYKIPHSEIKQITIIKTL